MSKKILEEKFDLRLIVDLQNFISLIRHLLYTKFIKFVVISISVNKNANLRKHLTPTFSCIYCSLRFTQKMKHIKLLVINSKLYFAEESV